MGVSVKELDGKVAAFFELLDEWSETEDVVLFRIKWMHRPLSSQVHPSFMNTWWHAIGGSWVGRRRGFFPFT